MFVELTKIDCILKEGKQVGGPNSLTRYQDQTRSPPPMAHQETPTSTNNNSDSLTSLGPCPLMDASIRTLSSPSPIVVDPGPTSPSSTHFEPCPQAWFCLVECKDTQSGLKTPNLDLGKRFCKEIGRLGRNIKQKLLCGFFSNSIISGKQKEDISSGDIVEPGTVVTNGIIEDSITPAIENQEGFWEADPYQLPQ